jgi:hypothetical protein
MDSDNYEAFIEGNLVSGVYKALDRLEEHDPETVNDPWFNLLGNTLDTILTPHIEKAYKER